MMTEEFEGGLAELRTLTANATVALMCAEAVPWRCHRSLVADALVAEEPMSRTSSAPSARRRTA